MKREMDAAILAVAAVTGTAFATGREVIFFFAQTGGVSWIGVLLGAVLYGAACGLVCARARREGAGCAALLLSDFPPVREAYALTMALLAGRMLSVAGRAALLTLPLRNAWGMGVAAAALTAIVSIRMKERKRSLFAAAALLTCIVFQTALAAFSPEMPQKPLYRTLPRLEGSVTAALILAALYAGLAVMTSSDAVAACAAGVICPVRCGFLCGSLFLMAIGMGNAAILSGGERVLSLSMPTVVLASCWGKAGYYASLGIMGVCAECTLCASLRALDGYFREKKCPVAMAAVTAAAALAGVVLPLG